MPYTSYLFWEYRGLVRCHNDYSYEFFGPSAYLLKILNSSSKPNLSLIAVNTLLVQIPN